MSTVNIHQLAFDYFFMLSRFEYALKNAGFVTADNDGNAQVNWNAFKNSIDQAIKIDLNDIHIAQLIKQRPARQLFKDNKLDWSKPQKIGNNDKKALIDSCLTIRNNLFHGGKYGDGNAGRNEMLLNAAIKILNAALTANEAVQHQYNLAEFN